MSKLVILEKPPLGGFFMQKGKIEDVAFQSVLSAGRLHPNN